MAPTSRHLVPQLALGTLLGILLVWFLFRDTEWTAISRVFQRVDLPWIAGSQILLWTSHLFRVERWTYVIRATHPVRYRPIFSAAQLGFLFNIVLPIRLGEGVRALLLSRLAKIRLSTSIALVALDRASDVVALIAVSLVALISFPSHRDVELPPGTFHNVEPYTVSSDLLRPLTLVAAFSLLAFLLILILLYAKQGTMMALFDRYTASPSGAIAARVRHAMTGFFAGMQLFSSTTAMTRALFFSLIAWGCSVLSLTFILKAFALTFKWYVPFAMQAMIALFVSAPFAPGLIGQFHLAVLACLLIAVPGVTLPEAKAVALGTHFLTILPVVALGLLSLFIERGKLLGSTIWSALGREK